MAPEAPPEGDATPLLAARCASTAFAPAEMDEAGAKRAPRRVTILPNDLVMSAKLKQAMLAVRFAQRSRCCEAHSLVLTRRTGAGLVHGDAEVVGRQDGLLVKAAQVMSRIETALPCPSSLVACRGGFHLHTTAASSIRRAVFQTGATDVQAGARYTRQRSRRRRSSGGRRLGRAPQLSAGRLRPGRAHCGAISRAFRVAFGAARGGRGRAGQTRGLLACAPRRRRARARIGLLRLA